MMKHKKQEAFVDAFMNNVASANDSLSSFIEQEERAIRYLK